MTDFLDLPSDYRHPDFASAFDELPLWSSYCGQLLLEHVPLKKNMRLLDVGCGTGFPLLELAARIGPGGSATGVDSWPEAMARLEFKKQFFGTRNVRGINCDASVLPFDDNSFDLVVSNLGVNNFEHPPKVLAECFRVTVPGGRIAITSNLVGHFDAFYETYGKVLTDLKMEHHLPALEAQEQHRSTIESLKQLLISAGYELAKTEEKSFTYNFADGTALFHHPLVRYGFLDGWRSVVDKSEERIVFAKLEKELNDMAAKQGQLAMRVPIAYVEGVKR